MMYAVIDFCEIAKERCVFADFLLRIYIYEDDTLIEVLPYNSYNLEKVRKLLIPIVFKADYGECIPKEGDILLGRLRLS